jgi:hypothetical protein
MSSLNSLFIPSTEWQEVPQWVQVPPNGEFKRDYRTGALLYRWKKPVPGPETVIDKRTGKPQFVRSPQPERGSSSPSYVQAVTPDQEQEYAGRNIEIIDSSNISKEDPILSNLTNLSFITAIQLPAPATDFPIHCLPEKARQMVKATASSINVHINLPASAILGACSAACGKGLFLQSGPDQRLRPNLFILGAAISGAGKSEGVRPIVAPFKNYEIQQRSLFEEITHPELESEKRLLEKRLNSIEGKLGKKTPGNGPLPDREALRKEHQDGISRLQQLKENLKGPSMIAEDVTQEEAAVLLSQNNEQLFLYSPDAAKALANLEGLYNKLSIPDENLFVKGFSGDPHIVHRISRPPVFLDSPCISLLWYVQPDLITRILENSRLRIGGFFARLLVCDTKLTPTEIPEDIQSIPQAVQEAYSTLVSNLLTQYWQAARNTKSGLTHKLAN